MNQHQHPPPPQQRPMGPPVIGRPGPMGPPGLVPYPPHRQPPRPVRRGRVWWWITGGVLVVAVVVGAGAVVGNMAQSEISSSPTATHTYPENYPEQKLPAQIDGFKLDLNGPAVYQILRPSRENPNVVDISRSERIGITDWGVREGGAKEYVEKFVKEYARDKETDELEPGVYCTKTEGETICYASSNSGRVWSTIDHFDSLTRKQQARWTVHFIAAVKE